MDDDDRLSNVERELKESEDKAAREKRNKENVKGQIISLYSNREYWD